MNLTDYQFPTLTLQQVAFSTLKADPVLLEEAERRGFYNGDTPYNKLFSELFFKGGTLNFKKDVDPEFRSKVGAYMRALMGSFEPSHEEKEAICALLLSELVEVKS